MANWERDVYAYPGDLVSFPTLKAFTIIDIDFKRVRMKRTQLINAGYKMLVLACFPDREQYPVLGRCAILLHPMYGMLWWPWP